VIRYVQGFALKRALLPFKVIAAVAIQAFRIQESDPHAPAFGGGTIRETKK